jgi:hypothetical protein
MRGSPDPIHTPRKGESGNDASPPSKCARWTGIVKRIRGFSLRPPRVNLSHPTAHMVVDPVHARKGQRPEWERGSVVRSLGGKVSTAGNGRPHAARTLNGSRHGDAVGSPAALATASHSAARCSCRAARIGDSGRETCRDPFGVGEAITRALRRCAFGDRRLISATPFGVGLPAVRRST